MTGAELRRLALTVYAPSTLYGVGQGAVLPVVALAARALGASIGVAGLVVAMAGVGQIIGDLPAGALAARIGERRAMLGSTVVGAVATVGCLTARAVWVLAAATLVTGMAGAVWGLARQAYLSDAVPLHLRARALSTLGGSQRIGMFVGPFLGAWAIHLDGVRSAYGVSIAASALAALMLLVLPEVPHADHVVRADGPQPGVLAVARAHLPVLRTLGAGMLLIGAVRASRQVVVPLWAEHLGLDATATSIVFGISGAVDMLLFYPAGRVMDRRGRTWVAVPSMVVLGLAHLALPLTVGVASLLVVAVLMGFGNGIGSGLVMTLGADAAPAVGRSQFLGAWRLCGDAGGAGGPLLVSAVSSVASLAPAVVLMGGVGLGAAGLLARWVPRHDPTRRTTSPGVVAGRR